MAPEIGITATPVIDRSAGPNGRVFVVMMETDGQGNYNYKLHALDLATGKDKNIYVLDSGNLGKFNGTQNKIYQELDGVNGGGAWSSPAYFNGSIYCVGIYNTLKRFQFDFSNPDKPLLNPTPAAQTVQTSFHYPGFTPSISSHGRQDAIVWGYEYDQYHAILHAYDATTLTELYSRGGLLAGGVKFAVPTICNGRVYLGTSNSLVAFGL